MNVITDATQHLAEQPRGKPPSKVDVAAANTDPQTHPGAPRF